MYNMVTGSIVTYNNISTIAKTLETLFGETKDIDFKLYVLDNGSSDGTPEYIEKNYPDVTVIRSGKNVGFGAGHNIIINQVESKYHAVINPDIVLTQNAVKKMADYMDGNPEIGLLSPRICFPDGRDQILGKRNPHLKYLVASRLRGDEPSKLLKEYAMLDCDLSKPTEIENATGCFMFIRTDVLKSIGGFDDGFFMYFEDADLARRINEISKCVYYPDAVVNHVWGRDSKRNFKLMLVHINSMLRYFRKWKTI
ncbi:MAG: glycosyltransferase family 2 protein [Clostridiaceae bacterium]|nr:glycosyltransferase family 2 protein [Clostridiaceae bacterium]MDY5890314.1 glycosyltransferase family 2 protein [Oscillospiraceae bacterium]